MLIVIIFLFSSPAIGVKGRFPVDYACFGPCVEVTDCEKFCIDQGYVSGRCILPQMECCCIRSKIKQHMSSTLI
ncbi:hypothetical protein ACET3Z_025606 [Daucus carota]